MGLKRLFRGIKSAPKPEAPTGPKKRILYVEDILTNWEICKIHLEDSYEMHHAGTTFAAIDQLKAHDFDLILMDIELQGSDMDGITLTQALKGKLEAPPPYVQEVGTIETPIIFLTAYTSVYGRSTAHKAGGIDLFSKPVDFEGLKRSIERVLEPTDQPA
ncbi:MAG: response regulator [Myxococcota bacterium]|nr:response regulator [Myxococcota bacterium]